MLVMIDDAQRAEGDSREWIGQLNLTGRQLSEREFTPGRLMMLVAARPQSGVDGTALQVERTLALAPLSDAARRDLIEALLPGQGLPLSLIDRISRASEGNILYLVDAARGLVQSGQLTKHNGLWQLNRPLGEIDLPHSIEELVMAELDSLSPEVRSVLQHASVIGRRFDYGALAAICPAGNLDQVLDELERRGLVTLAAGAGHERVYAFTQSVVREVAYHSILCKTRRDLHDHIAHLSELRQEAGVATDVEMLARHFAEGGDADPDKRLRYNWLSGRDALAQCRFEDAYGYLSNAWNALSPTSTVDPGVRSELAKALGDAATFTGN
jgi:predicted ATPase